MAGQALATGNRRIHTPRNGKRLPERQRWWSMTRCLEKQSETGIFFLVSFLSRLSLLLQIYGIFNLPCYLSVSEQMHSLQALRACQLLASCWELWEDFQWEPGQPNNSSRIRRNRCLHKEAEKVTWSSACLQPAEGRRGRNHRALTGALAWQQDAECLGQNKQMFEFPQS